jgi:hypothetical protein
MNTLSFTIAQRLWNSCNVLHVERRLSVAREVKSLVEKALVRAGRLRQAVLRSACEGRL